jgi:YjbE family integral membrane protein
MVIPGVDFIVRALQIVLIDVLLAGDNAVVIAMAVRSLSPAQRRTGTLVGGGFAIVLRIILTFFAARILELPYFRLIGGFLIFWIAVKLLTDSGAAPDAEPSARSLRQAIWIILVADITMSLDNIIAVAAASKGSLTLLIAGLGLSISFVMFMSGFLARLMDRYPVILWGGAAILGQVAGDLIVNDPSVLSGLRRVPFDIDTLVYCCEAALALLVLLLGLLIKSKRRKETESIRVS